LTISASIFVGNKDRLNAFLGNLPAVNEYDEMNRKIKVTDPDGNTTRIFYDNTGNIVKYVEPGNYNPEKDDGVGTTYLYDSMNRLIQIVNAAGIVVEKIYTILREK